VYEHTKTHDAAGNVDATWGKDTRGGASNPEVVTEETRSYYSADDRLMYFNRQFGLIDPGKPESVFEEYRYDALGRRVFTRSRRPSNCPSPCPAYAERTVWDGDQVLMELRSSGGTADTLFLDGDGAARDSISRPLFGVVTYLHAQGIDQPLGVLKKYADVETWKYVTPHANWRGEYSNGTFANGDDCLTVSDECPHWPGFLRTGDRGELGPQPQTYQVWWGNLLSGRAEASGLQYLRNRYYDAKTGRFTQLDPIGLAGGVNLYGFADGDPVNFSDPFGLCPVCALYAAFEIGSTLYDVYDLGKTTFGFFRGRVSRIELGVTAAGVGAGVLGFGGGYGRLGREATSRLMRDFADNPENWKVVGSFTEAATSRKAKGGLSIQTIIENESGDRLVRHTVLDKSGRIVEDHYRPMFKPRDVDRPER
jgi:RHS repeat-associated protein